MSFLQEVVAEQKLMAPVESSELTEDQYHVLFIIKFLEPIAELGISEVLKWIYRQLNDLAIGSILQEQSTLEKSIKLKWRDFKKSCSTLS